MQLKDYEKFVKNSTYTGGKYWYACLGLAGETGETVDEIKKVMRDNGGIVTTPYRDKLRLEMGDVMWYLTRLALDLDLSLEEILEANVEKLIDRRKNGKKAG